MTESQLDELIRELAPRYNTSSEPVPRELLWRRIEAQGAWGPARRPRSRPWVRTAAALAAALVLGIGLGRTTGGGEDREPPASPPGGAGGLARRAAAQHLFQARVLLLSFRGDAGAPHWQPAAWAGELRAQTQLLLASPAADDARLRRLLEELEATLGRIEALPAVPEAAEVQTTVQEVEGLLSEMGGRYGRT
ncbi:MAG TPA: hypothetical protein VGV85_09400 [Longimicrobiaceae bacterium]|nr:hypothetical protein [Longimicrobiaceae bacterium]